jgi:hypothetical protein
LSLLERGDHSAARDSSWPYPSKRWVSDARRLVALEQRLAARRRGEGEPLDAEDRVRLALEVCKPKKLFAEAAALYAEAFQIDPSLTAQRDPCLLLEAVSAGMAGGLGEGADPPAADDARAALRGRARGWFEEEISSCESVTPKDASAMAVRLKPWTESPYVAVIANGEPRGLPSAEVEAGRALWKRFAALRGVD